MENQNKDAQIQLYAQVALLKRQREFFDKYHNDRVGFARDCFKWRQGEGPVHYQYDILSLLDENYWMSRVAVMGPRGLGKSFIAAVAILHFAVCMEVGKKDWKVITSASNAKQLEKFLWPEVNKVSQFLDWNKIPLQPFRKDKEMFMTKIKGKSGYAAAVNSDDKESIEGAHADFLMYVFDEAKAIREEIFDASEGAFASTGESVQKIGKILMISTPPDTSPTGRFVDIHKRKKGFQDWKLRHVTKEEAIDCGRMDASWAEAQRLKWGESDPRYIAHVLGQIPEVTSSGVVPQAWYQLATQRARMINDWGKIIAIGVDIADGDGDASVVAVRREAGIKEIFEISQDGPVETRSVGMQNQVMKYLRENEGIIAVLDASGSGSNFTANIIKQVEQEGLDVEVVRFVASGSTKNKKGKMMTDQHGNFILERRREAAWWRFRELLDPYNGGNIAIQANDTLEEELITPMFSEAVGDSGKIRIESKKDLRKARRLGRSTNYADAVIQAYWPIFAPENDEVPFFILSGSKSMIGSEIYG